MRRLALFLVLLFSALGGLVLDTSRSEASTQALYTTQTCSTTQPGMVRVTLFWTGNDPTALQQWVDVGTVGPSWGQGTFASFGPLAAATTALTWDGAASNSIYYIRINQQLSTGTWDPSPTFQVVTVDCSSATASAASPPPSGQQGFYIYSPQTQQAAYIARPQSLYAPIYYAPPQHVYVVVTVIKIVHPSHSTPPSRVLITGEKGSALVTRY